MHTLRERPQCLQRPHTCYARSYTGVVSLARAIQTLACTPNFTPLCCVRNPRTITYATTSCAFFIYTMQTSKLQNYLRKHRKQRGFSQREVLFLIGSNDISQMSAYESFAREPKLETILALELVFTVPAQDLFRGSFERTAAATLERTRRLTGELQQMNQRRNARRKLAWLQRIEHYILTSQRSQPMSLANRACSLD